MQVLSKVLKTILLPLESVFTKLYFRLVQQKIRKKTKKGEKLQHFRLKNSKK